MDILYKLERACVGQVLAKLADKPSYSTLRAQLRVLEEKGYVRHEDHGRRYAYIPAVPRDVARRSALRHLVETFFDGSTEKNEVMRDDLAAVFCGHGHCEDPKAGPEGRPEAKQWAHGLRFNTALPLSRSAGTETWSCIASQWPLVLR